MTSYHVTCHVTAVSHAPSLSIKEKEIQKKRNIKSRKIDKRKRKMLVLICIIIGRDKDCLLGEPVDYDQNSVKFRE